MLKVQAKAISNRQANWQNCSDKQTIAEEPAKTEVNEVSLELCNAQELVGQADADATRSNICKRLAAPT